MTRLFTAAARIVHIVSNVTGLAPEQAQLLCWVVLGYIIGISLLIFWHKHLRRRLHTQILALTGLYDRLWYLVAKAQQASGQARNSKGISVLFDQTSPNYLQHEALIREEIGKIEQATGSSILTPAYSQELIFTQKKYNKLHTFTSILGWTLRVLTAFVYALVW